MQLGAGRATRSDSLNYGNDGGMFEKKVGVLEALETLLPRSIAKKFYLKMLTRFEKMLLWVVNVKKRQK